MASLWTSVIQSPEELITRIESFTPNVEDYGRFKTDLLRCSTMPTQRVQTTDIGFKKLGLHQMSYSGLGTKAGGPMSELGARWSPVHLREKIHAVHELLRRVEIRENACTCLDFADVITDKTTNGFMFLDPPYWEKGNQLYQIGFGQADPERLAALLRETTHPWLLTHDDCAAIRDLYHLDYARKHGSAHQ